MALIQIETDLYAQNLHTACATYPAVDADLNSALSRRATTWKPWLRSVPEISWFYEKRGDK